MFRQLATRSFTSARGYASAAKKAPIVVHGIDGKYATALFNAASAKGTLEKVDSDLSVIQKAITSDPRFKEALISPLIKQEDKEKILLGRKLSETTKNFVSLLAQNGRVSILQEIIGAYTQLMKAYNGVVPVRVTSASTLDAKTLKEVEATIASNEYVKDYKKLEVVNVLNPNILGGMVIEFGDYTLDMSVSTKIAKLEKLLHGILLVYTLTYE
ncbi:ATP synthase subunit 5, mitochondrial [Zancudomyces culisetae]|uniref:ATP synthase subunit 5, mitochondrial n=1 Tax=Zancudomyces culisetae TaxID=1213189 RepID=A0A1R1PRM0_ZANCU|nr:ATP synthase subunit 5, mitochondrial [Zancudomyces culisetae]OMH85001.1 ATP synthase subunit 5, mitochondrial [Zancudomyces culisetae]|eukprot:OMH83625.1 ATP synthase subunit 5, mitochondrial [Zancudomyces culisetae]